MTTVPMNKAAFKQGCEEGGGSYIENPDGSFQCNLRDGGTIWCPSTTEQCSYTKPLTRGTEIEIALETEPAGIYRLPLSKGTSLVINLEAEMAGVKRLLDFSQRDLTEPTEAAE